MTGSREAGGRPVKYCSHPGGKGWWLGLGVSDGGGETWVHSGPELDIETMGLSEGVGVEGVGGREDLSLNPRFCLCGVLFQPPRVKARVTKIGVGMGLGFVWNFPM